MPYHTQANPIPRRWLVDDGTCIRRFRCPVSAEAAARILAASDPGQIITIGATIQAFAVSDDDVVEIDVEDPNNIPGQEASQRRTKTGTMAGSHANGGGAE